MADSSISLRNFLSEPFVSAFIVGCVMDGVRKTVTSPLERMQIIYQVQDHTRTEYKMSMIRVIAKIWKEEKWKGYWRGNGVNCLRAVGHSMVMIESYEFYKGLWLRHETFDSHGRWSLLPRFTLAGLASITGVCCTYPLDLVQTRLTLQTASFKGVNQTYRKAPPGVLGTVINIYRFEGGIRALYRGVPFRIVSVAPFAGIKLWNYERFQERFQEHAIPEGREGPSAAVGKFGSNVMATAVAQFITCPLYDIVDHWKEMKLTCQ